MDLDELLEQRERQTPFDKMIKYGQFGTLTNSYKRRLKLLADVKQAKSAHRNIIFADSPDVTLNPMLSKDTH